jgi:hypothetical protein
MSAGSRLDKLKNSVHPIALALLVGLAAGQPETFHYNSHAWQELSWRHSIKRLHLPPSLKADLIETLVEQMREDDSEADSPNGHVSDEQLRDIAGETRIAFVDLTGHGKHEIIAQAGGENSGCSPTGNCRLWVLRRQRDGYHVVLDAPSEQTFTIQPHRTKGLNDLVLSMHGSATDSTLRLYKFNGSSYAHAACYDANWEIADENGKFHDLQEPRLTPCR